MTELERILIMPRHIALFTAVFATMSCGLPFGLEDSDLPLVEPVESEYRVSASSAQVMIVYVLFNRTDRALYVGKAGGSTCGGIEIEYQPDDSDQWLPALTERFLCALALSPPSVVAPGQALKDSVGVVMDADWVPGRHRVRILAISDDLSRDGRTLGSNLPQRLRVSGAFTLR